MLLKTQAAQALGLAAAAKLVKLSPRPAELDGSITQVARTLNGKAALNKEERRLERAVKEMARTQ